MNIYCPFTRSNPIMMSNLHNSTRRFNDASKLNKKKRQKKRMQIFFQRSISKGGTVER